MNYPHSPDTTDPARKWAGEAQTLYESSPHFDVDALEYLSDLDPEKLPAVVLHAARQLYRESSLYDTMIDDILDGEVTL